MKEWTFFPRRSKLAFAAFIILPLLLLIPVFIEIFNQGIIVFPKDTFGSIQSRIEAYTDSGFGGKSSIDEYYFDSKKFVFEYTLRKKGSSPMVFITIWLDCGGTLLDLSKYHVVRLRIREITSKRITLFIKTFLDNITLPGHENAITLRHNQYILYPSQNRKDYRIYLREFTTDRWWFDHMGISADEVPEESFKKVTAFDLQFSFRDSDTGMENKEKIIIEKIAFQTPLSPAVPLIIGFMVLYYAGLGILIIIKRRNKKKYYLPQRESLEISSFRDKELKRINNFIKSKYTDPDISTKMIYKELGIPSRRVFKICKEAYQLSFKRLINKMRIEEAKRLLTETDLKVIEIAFHLGFNDVSYFNRLFKQEEGVAPLDYRDQQDKKSSGRI